MWNEIKSRKFLCLWYYWFGEEKQISSVEIRICNTQPESSIRNSVQAIYHICQSLCFETFSKKKCFAKMKNSACTFVARQLIIYLKNVKHMYQPCCLVFRVHPFPSDVLQYLLDVLPSGTGYLAGALPQAILQGQEAHWMNTANIGLLEKYLLNSNLFPNLRSYCGIGFGFSNAFWTISNLFVWGFIFVT